MSRKAGIFNGLTAPGHENPGAVKFCRFQLAGTGLRGPREWRTELARRALPAGSAPEKHRTLPGIFANLLQKTAIDFQKRSGTDAENRENAQYFRLGIRQNVENMLFASKTIEEKMQTCYNFKKLGSGNVFGKRGGRTGSDGAAHIAVMRLMDGNHERSAQI